MEATFCIECGREIKFYLSQTLHHCNICETKKNRALILDRIGYKE